VSRPEVLLAGIRANARQCPKMDTWYQALVHLAADGRPGHWLGNGSIIGAAQVRVLVAPVPWGHPATQLRERPVENVIVTKTQQQPKSHSIHRYRDHSKGVPTTLLC